MYYKISGVLVYDILTFFLVGFYSPIMTNIFGVVASPALCCAMTHLILGGLPLNFARLWLSPGTMLQNHIFVSHIKFGYVAWPNTNLKVLPWDIKQCVFYLLFFHFVLCHN